LIFGDHFNSVSGPGGKLQFTLGGKVHDLVDLQWTDHSVSGHVPDGWNWSYASKVDMWLTRADGARSNTIQADFTPIYEIQALPGSAVHAECGGADRNFCFSAPLHDNSPTIDTTHATSYGQDARTDHYTTDTLSNGWTLYDFSFTKSENHGNVQYPSGFQDGANHLDLRVHWDEDGGNIFTPHTAATGYQIVVRIVGPKGFPWK
jgi:hypothetical protein